MAPPGLLAARNTHVAPAAAERRRWPAIEDATMPQPLWVDNLERLSESLLAQLARIRAGSTHATTKGGSLEAVVRRTLREYLPGYFGVASGQIANGKHELSPQLDVIVYDQSAFPHLAVNEDSSVV